MFQFMTATRIIFGEGALQASLSVLNQFGYSVLLVTGQDLSRAQPVIGYLKSQNMRYQHVAISGETLHRDGGRDGHSWAKIQTRYGGCHWWW